MEIRKATTADIDGLLQMRFAFLRVFRSIDDQTQVQLEPELRRYFAEHLGKDDFTALLAVDNNTIVSTVLFTVAESPPNDQYPNGRIAYVFNVYTLPEYRGKGLATRLMERMVETAKAMNVTAINLNASAAGRPIYEDIGFKVLSDTAMRMTLR